MRTNYSILPWYSDTKYQHHNEYSKAPISINVNQVPPFQYIREKTGNQIIEFVLIDFATGAETDILTAIQLAGLEVLEPTGKNYDIIKYPASVPIVTSPLLSPVLYYARMKDAVNTWYSELFVMCENIDELIKIEFCHSEDFCYVNGHIDYTNFENFVYIPGGIANPVYEYEEDVDKRNGENLPITQTSWKLHSIHSPLLPEYLADAMRLIRLHDYITVKFNGQTYNVNEFIFNPGDWQGNTGLVQTEIQFKTDRVTVQIAGRGVTAASCEIDAGGCVDIDYYPVAEINESSAEYTGGYYINSLGANVPFAVGEHVMINETGGSRVLYTYNSPGSYTEQTGTLTNENAYIADTDIYYFRKFGPHTWGKTSMSYIVDDPNWEITFASVPGTIAEFYYVGPEGEVLAAVETVDTINLPIDLPIIDGVTHIRMKVYNTICGNFQTVTIAVSGVITALVMNDLTALVDNSGVALVS